MLLYLDRVIKELISDQEKEFFIEAICGRSEGFCIPRRKRIQHSIVQTMPLIGEKIFNTK
ncbi:hypothetical protein DN068_10915 [Taibaiella soli]|uniref:Uncharacterized protein n=1 Tax=Taibaiella soli TaxID=1649169 RepID=A0A2W2AY07_9BACT|nr:hypothetical protein DN068_10915 [Taibaiella soli]